MKYWKLWSARFVGYRLQRCGQRLNISTTILFQCPKVFKSYCEVNADCPCSEQPLMCEEHECVKAKVNPSDIFVVNILRHAFIIVDIKLNQCRIANSVVYTVYYQKPCQRS